MPYPRSPYVVRARRVNKFTADAKDGAASWMGFGDDLKQGVEVRIQTERGGLSIKVWRNEYGDEQVAFRAIPHTDFGGRRVGLDSLLWQGTIDGEFHGQRSLFGPEPD